MSEETAIPEGRAKAEAMRTFLATGGGRVSRGNRSNGQFKYRKGKLQGRTHDQAISMFEDMWASAHPAIKDKYAKRTSAEGVLAPSEMVDLRPVPGRVYGDTQSAVATPTPVSQPASPPRGRPLRPDMQAPGAPGSTAQGPPDPAVFDAMRRREGGAPPFTPSEVTPTGRPNLSPLANRELDRRRAASEATPTGRPVMDRKAAGIEGIATGGRVNRLTGLPMGFQPGDKLPTGADGAMQGRADQSMKRQQIAESQAGRGKPIGSTQPAPSGYAGPGMPETRFTPGIGHVPVAKPVTNGDEKIGYDQYDAARTRRTSSGSSVDQDRKDFAIENEFGRQQKKRDSIRNRQLERSGRMQAGRIVS